MGGGARPPEEWARARAWLAGEEPSGAGRRMRRSPAVTALVVAAVAWIWFANAWITDDAYITFRTVEQLLAGNGLRFNVHERVQSYTHPLWLAALLPFRLFGSPLPAAALLLSASAFGATLVLLGWPARGRARRAFLAVAVALASRTWIDFSSSGLETPMTALLVVLFAQRLLRGGTRDAGTEPSTFAVLAASLLLLTRLDHAPLVLPGLALAVWRRREAGGPWRRELLVGFAPLLAWSLAALLYYGTPLPNTAHAKLAAGVPRAELVAQGWRYLVVTARWDLLLAPLLGAAAWLAYRGRAAERALVAGVVLHLAYVVAIGGDFMAGRFLVPAAAAALALLVERAPDRLLLPGGALACTLLAFAPHSALRFSPGSPPAWPRGAVGKAGIVDEKAAAEGSEWLRAGLRSGWRRPASEPLTPPRVVGTLGRPGYRAHPRQVLVDRFALADPFLARLRYEPPWQPGHFRRRLPEGYLESVAAGANHLADPELARLYDDVHELVSGPLFGVRRLGLAAKLLMPAPARAAPVERRCPALRIEPPEGAASARPGDYRLAARFEVDARRLVARGIAPLGEHAARWQLVVRVAPTPQRGAILCQPQADRAPIGIVVELDFASESDARSALARGPALELTPALRDPAPCPQP